MCTPAAAECRPLETFMKTEQQKKSASKNEKKNDGAVGEESRARE